jgi:tetratricopeptide (TPR) repeat protein
MVLSGAPSGANRYELQWRLARALFFLGQEAKSVGDKRQLYAAGIGAGERAVALNPERVEGHFWVGVNLALFAEANGGIRGARAVRWARSELKLATRINERYHDAGALRALGRLEHKAPRILGANRKLSRRCFERAIEIAPSNSVTLVYAAEFFIDEGECERARALLERVITAPIDEEWKFENLRDKEIARRLLESIARQ